MTSRLANRRTLRFFASAGVSSPSWTTSPIRNKAAIIDGRSVAEKIKQEVASEIAAMKRTIGQVPRLAVVLVGTRKDSKCYVNHKTIACAEMGLASLCVKLPENVSEEELLNVVKDYNNDPSIHGVLVQLPLPKHMNEERVLGAISLQKDVDGCHPSNIGDLVLGKQPLYLPCAAQACLHLLAETGISLSGKYAVVIGWSNIVGLPTRLLLQHHNATVTTVHKLTKNPEQYTQAADILVSAAGCPNLVRGHWIKPGAVVIDVGINHVQRSVLSNAVQSPSHGISHNKSSLVGDVCFSEACEVASAISPVPGGVGPVTIAKLLQNTVRAAKLSYGLT